MMQDMKQEIALFRYGILAPFITGTVEEGMSKKGFFKMASQRKYKYPDGKMVGVSMTTLARWHAAYAKGGLEGLVPKRRADCGKSRKLDDDAKSQIEYLRKEYPRIPATMIHQKLMDNGTLGHKELSLSTVTRYVSQLKTENGESANRDMRRYEREHINEAWYGDSSVAIYLNIDGKKKRTYVMALIDDHSRYIVGVDIFFSDTYLNLMGVLKSAVSRAGIPKVLSFDNGAAYKNKQMELLAARIGTSLNYCTPYTPTSKAKIERWFKTMKTSWMSQLRPSDFPSLEELRTSLLAYVDTYNKKPHSSLDGDTPENRFFSDSRRIRRLSPERIDQAFLLEQERRVSADSVIILNDTEYEVHYRYARHKITLRYAPDLSTVYLVDPVSGELSPLRLLNKHENSQVKREKVSLTGGGR